MLQRDQLRAAYAFDERSTPRVRMNFVASIDGAVTVDGHSGGLGGESDRALMQVLRALSDVVLVGAGTVLAEGYGGVRLRHVDASWRESRGLSAQPRLAVVSRELSIAAEHPFFADAAVRPLVITCAAAPAEQLAALAGVAEVLVCGDESVDLAAMLAALAARGLPQVLCEGGPHVFGALAAAGLVDEVCLTLSPTLIGGDAGRIVRGAPEMAREMRLVHAISDDEGFVFLRYAAARPASDPDS